MVRAAARAGTHKARNHFSMPRPTDATYDVNPDLVSALFMRYSEPSGHGSERLVDIESL